MSTEAATWVRFTRLIPIEISVRMSAQASRQSVATLHGRGWTADDIAHAVLVGAASARNPAALIQHNLTNLLDGNVPPPTDPDVTPTPDSYDPSLRGPGTEKASEWAARIRAELAERKSAGTGPGSEATA